VDPDVEPLGVIVVDDVQLGIAAGADVIFYIAIVKPICGAYGRIAAFPFERSC
jgi:hypothetical protein